MLTAIFTVTCPKSNKIVRQYNLQYSTMAELEADFLESRQVWSEYMVTVTAEDSKLTALQTWRDEFLMTI